MIAYIPTRATPRLRAHHLARELGLQAVMVCDNRAQADALLKTFGVPHRDIVIDEEAPGPPCGAPHKRDFVCRKVAARGEWLVWLDDNVSHLEGLAPCLSSERIDFGVAPPPPRKSWREAFARRLTRDEVWHYIHQTLERAAREGTINCGFATEHNYFFRRLKWQLFGYCRSQFTLYKNDGSTWLPPGCPDTCLEDMVKTVDVVARYGCVVVNRHMKPVKPFFEAGGVGTLEERLPYLRNTCKWLIGQYPGLVRYSKRRDYHVTFAKTNRRTVDGWRRAHGYLGNGR